MIGLAEGCFLTRGCVRLFLGGRRRMENDVLFE